MNTTVMNLSDDLKGRPQDFLQGVQFMAHSSNFFDTVRAWYRKECCLQ